jgi:hypothetical protein
MITPRCRAVTAFIAIVSPSRIMAWLAGMFAVFALAPVSALGATGEITGRVTDAATGVGIANVSVSVFGPAGSYGGSTMTDSGGRYTVAGLATGKYTVGFSSGPGGNYIAQFYDGKSSIGSADLVAVTAGSSTPGIDAALSPVLPPVTTVTGSISGTVTNAATGGAVAGIDVTVYSSVGSATTATTTDGAGRYTISGLAPGTCLVGFAGTGFVTQFYNGKSTLASANPLSIRAASITTGINAAMVSAPRPTAAISGTATDAGTHAALAGIWVTVYTSAGQRISSTTTGPTGGYIIAGLTPATYKVEFAGTGFVTQFYDNEQSLASADPVTVSGGSTTSDINAALAALTVVRSPTPSGVTLSGLASNHPRLRFTVAHGTNAPDLKTITVASMNGGLGLSNNAIVKVCSGKAKHRKCQPIIKGVTITGGTIKTWRLSSGRLVLQLNSPSPKITLTLSTPLLNESKSLRTKAQQRKATGLKSTVNVTDTTGKTTTLLLRLS